jgi:hypothetical protein
LHGFQADLVDALGAQVDIRAAEDGAALLIRGRSPQQMADVIAVLRDAVRLLRMNRAIDLLSRDIRAV